MLPSRTEAGHAPAAAAAPAPLAPRRLRTSASLVALVAVGTLVACAVQWVAIDRRCRELGCLALMVPEAGCAASALGLAPLLALLRPIAARRIARIALLALGALGILFAWLCLWVAHGS